MMNPKSLLPSKTFEHKTRVIFLLTIAVFLWVAYFINYHYTHTKESRLTLQERSLSQYQDTLKTDASSLRHKTLFTHDLATKSDISFHVLTLLKRYPNINLIRIKKPPRELTPQEEKRIESKKITLEELLKEKPLPSGPYLNLLPDEKVDLFPYHVAIEGTYGNLAQFVDLFMLTTKPVVIRKLSINGENYPNNELSLDLLFFTRGAQ